jgi:hypothetical protein
MDEKLFSITKRVLKKLSALRATLSDDERVILDRMVTGAAIFDVETHAMVTRPEAGAPELAKQDVVAQSMATRSATRATTDKPENKIVFDEKQQVYKLIS